MKHNEYSYWRRKNWYYHQYMSKFYQFIVPVQARVLVIGSKLGHILKDINPACGVGVEPNQEFLHAARAEFPEYDYYQLISDVPVQKFDYIVLALITMEADDVQELLMSLQPFCDASTRLVVDTYSYLWEPVLSVAQWLGLKRPAYLKNWLALEDLNNIMYISGFEVITQGNQLLLPVYVPAISWFFNSIVACLPLINQLCLSRWSVARRSPVSKNAHDISVSVIIPCRNERGNVEDAVKRCPKMGYSTELIFVEGHSQDGTLQEMERVKGLYPELNIMCLVQDGKGKGDAVRKGFEHATGHVLMILDADLTVMPEELPKFLDALVQGKGEFINGSRLVYSMQDKAMRLLNLFANYCFGIAFSWLLGQRVKDTLCGTKVLYKKDYQQIVSKRGFFGEFDPFGDFDLLFGAAKQNLKIIEMPVHYKARVYGQTQIRRFYHGLILMRMCLVGLRKFKLR